MAVPPPDSTEPNGRYPGLLQVLHWSIALLFGLQIALAVVLRQLQSVEIGQLVLSAHRIGGVTILVLILLRIVVSPWVRPPRSASTLPPWQVAAAHAMHALLILALIAQAFLGIVVAWSRGDPVTLFGMVEIPDLVVLSNARAAQVEAAHAGLAYGLMGLVGLHVAAILFNRLVRRTSVMERMLPAISTARLADRIPVAGQLALCFAAILAVTTASGLYGAGQYKVFKDLQTRFDETEVSVLDDLRTAQVAQKTLQVLLVDPDQRAEAAAEAARAAASDLASFPGRLTDPAARAAAVAAVEAAAQLANGDHSADRLGEVDTQLQAAVDSQFAHVFQGRLDIARQAARGHDLVILALCPALLIGAVLAFLLSRSILGALARMRRVVQAVERGESLDQVFVRGDGDFARLMRDIGRMQAAVVARQHEARDRSDRDAARQRATRQSVVVEELADGLAALAQGDLRRRIEAPFEGGYEKIRVDFNDAMSALEAVISKITATTHQVGASSADLARAAGELAVRTEREAVDLRQTSTALDAVTRRVEESAKGARGAAVAVNAAREEAEGSREVVSTAIQAMSDIEVSSEQIAQIIGVVDEVAFQTSLLALNAGIEAARAGEAGKSFGIIAQEVRALSSHSAGAAKQIKALVLASRSKVALGSELVGRTGEALQRVAEKVGEIDVLVRSIAEAAAEQAGSLSEVNQAIGRIDRIVEQNAAMVQQTTGSAAEMRRSAHALDGFVQRFGKPAAAPAPRLNAVAGR